MVDDPRHPDPAFAEAYARLPEATELEPWLTWCRAAAGPALYLGIGAGRLAAPLAAAGVELVGVDAHPGMLGAVARRLPGIELHQSLIESLPVEDASVDLVISNGVIDLIPDKDAVFGEIDRVLRSGGRLQIADVVIHTEVSEDARARIDLWTG